MMKKSFKVNTEIIPIESSSTLLKELNLREGDLLVLSQKIYDKLFKDLNLDIEIIVKDSFYKGPNNDESIKTILSTIKRPYNRVIGIGSSSITDLAKILSLSNIENLDLILKNRIEVKRQRELILVPTTPGIGNEVAPFVFLHVEKTDNIDLMQDKLLCADLVYICYDTIEDISDTALLSSTFDAFVQSFDSFLSPISTCISRSISKEAIKMFIEVMLDLANNDNQTEKMELLKKCLLAGTMSGISYANIGNSINRSLAYPLHSRLKIRYGLANYLIFFDVLKAYDEKNPYGKLDEIKDIFAISLQCPKDRAFYEFERICNSIFKKNSLSFYGMQDNQILEFTDMVMLHHDFIEQNGYISISFEDIANLYKKLL